MLHGRTPDRDAPSATGRWSLYLHCDPTASHYLKQLLDAIFGRKQFSNEIIWKYKYGGRSKSHFGRKHDIILYYTKTSKAPFYMDAVRVPHESESLELNFRHVDEDGRRYREGKWKSGKRYRYYADEGRTPDDVWTDINSIHASDRNRTGYQTEKPLTLYERIIKASSDAGDWVLDPFAGCATTCVAAERLGRKWVGIDLWEETHRIILDRLQAEGLAAPDGSVGQQLAITTGDITYTDQLPERTDEGEAAAPFLQVTERYAEPAGPRMSRPQMLDHLIAQHGCCCQGCDRDFDDPRYLQLDHNTPRADGGINHITNRVLLCGPCNQLKAHRFTLSGLREQNRKLGFMAR